MPYTYNERNESMTQNITLNGHKIERNLVVNGWTCDGHTFETLAEARRHALAN